MRTIDLLKRVFFIPALAFLMAGGFVPEACAKSFSSDGAIPAAPSQKTETDASSVSLKDLKQAPVELTGDNVEYKADEGKFVASGNVVVRQSGATLFCDRVEFYRDRQEAHAVGKVELESDRGMVWADKAFYNFKTKKGEFTNARIMAAPIYGRAESISKVRDNYYVMTKGYLTTSDYDDPEWRVRARQIELFPDDKAVIHNATMFLGGFPVMFMPKYVQDLRKDRPHFRVVPGYKKAWGAFVLSSYRVYPVKGVETVYHLDYRDKKGFAWGLDTALTALPVGNSLVKTYFMDSRSGNINMSTGPVDPNERHRLEWRHKWDIDPATSLILQYYNLSDSQILKDYFEKEYRADGAPQTFALLTHTTPGASMSVRIDKRVNRFESVVERLPEVNYSWNNQEVGDTGFYFKSTNSAVALEQRAPDTTDRDHRTMRFLTDNEVSRPFKLSFLELRPFAGTEQTFYTRALDRRDDDSFRGVFKAGMDASTKFYRIYDAQFKSMGIEVNKLRHVITPTVAYLYQHAPTMATDKFYQFDSVDARVQVHKFGLGFENKLQTKREGVNVDLMRSLLTTNYYLSDNKEVTERGGFGEITLDDEFYFNEHVSFSHDLTYDPENERLKTANYEFHFTDAKKWNWDIGRRYTVDDDDLITTQLAYQFNPKWRAVVYERMNADNGQWQEQQYALVRDLHSWEVEVSFNNRLHVTDSGNEVWVIFRLKAFPSVGFDGGASFKRTRPGSGN